MVILSSYYPRTAPRTLVPITRWPFVFAKWRLRHASNSSTLPPFAAFLPTVAFIPLDPQRLSTLPGWENRSSLHLLASSRSKIFLPPPACTTIFVVHHSSRPFVRSSRSPIPFARPLRPLSEQVLSTPSSFLLSSSVTSMIILRSAINRKRWERAIGCRFDPAFMDVLLPSIRSESHFCYIKSDKKFCCFP